MFDGLTSRWMILVHGHIAGLRRPRRRSWPIAVRVPGFRRGRRGRPLDELADDVERAVDLADVVDLYDRRMFEAGDDAGGTKKRSMARPSAAMAIDLEGHDPVPGRHRGLYRRSPCRPVRSRDHLVIAQALRQVRPRSVRTSHRLRPLGGCAGEGKATGRLTQGGSHCSLGVVARSVFGLPYSLALTLAKSPFQAPGVHSAAFAARVRRSFPGHSRSPDHDLSLRGSAAGDVSPWERGRRQRTGPSARPLDTAGRTRRDGPRPTPRSRRGRHPRIGWDRGSAVSRVSRIMIGPGPDVAPADNQDQTLELLARFRRLLKAARERCIASASSSWVPS